MNKVIMTLKFHMFPLIFDSFMDKFSETSRKPSSENYNVFESTCSQSACQVADLLCR